MFVAVGLQCAFVAILAIVGGLWFDWTSARSVVLGGAVAIIPNGLFALRLATHRGKAPESYPVVFFLGEFAKIGLTVALLVLVARSVESVQWLPLLLGLIVALKAPLFAMLLVRERRRPTADGASPGSGHDGRR
jgi:ATP synthase protein I